MKKSVEKGEKHYMKHLGEVGNLLNSLQITAKAEEERLNGWLRRTIKDEKKQLAKEIFKEIEYVFNVSDGRKFTNSPDFKKLKQKWCKDK